MSAWSGTTWPARVGPRWRLVGPACLAALAAAVFGALLSAAPVAAVGGLGAIWLVFVAPPAAVCLLLAVTVLVPFAWQDALSVVDGPGLPSVLFVDLLLLLGLGRLAALVLRGRLAISAPLLLGTVALVVCSSALVVGAQGAGLNPAGHEARTVVLGVGAFLLAWPIVVDQRVRRGLGPVLLTTALALGVWGLAQWVFSVPYTSQGDIGVRPGVDITSPGPGQLQGGLFAYPVAVTMVWAALVIGWAGWSVRVRWLLAVALALNVACLFVTYERSLWAATAVASVVVVARAERSTRRRAVRFGGSAAALMVVVLAVIAPSELRAAGERVTSVSQLNSDTSLGSRMVEWRAAVAAIRSEPLTGSGFGATMTWGNQEFATTTTPFVHSGYLWLAWKIGIPAAAALTALLGFAALRRRVGGEDPEWSILRAGSQAAVLALLLINVFFPVWNMLGITAALGTLVAVCFSPPGRSV